MNITSVCVFLFCLACHVDSDAFHDTLGHIKPQTSPEVQAKSAYEVIRRTIPGRADEFFIEVDPKLGPIGKDTFEVRKLNGKIKIKGTTGVAATTGFHHYLKYYCNAHISWETSQLNLPEVLPAVNITITLNDRFRYYQNVCTTSYSFVWWNWKQWETHIDWMALNSFNLVLAFNGQEAIWERVYKKLNLTQQDIDEHFTGPAFLSWLRMGNIRGWAGPLSKAWHDRSIWLQKKILEKMRNLGIIPVLPAFAGHLPRAFKRVYPNVNVTQMEKWNQFNDTYCCPNFLEPTEPMFKTIGKMFLKEQTAEFGTDHVYNCDSFNEVDPSTSDLTYLANVGKSIYSAMIEVDPEAIWIMQGWLFYSSPYWENTNKVRAFVTSIPMGKMIILDLQSEQFPQYDRLEQYYGQPYIWCMLHDFGGTLGMFGSAEIINERVVEARNTKNSTMIGTGLTPEGINQNYVIYDLMTESTWRTGPADLDMWFRNYTIRRYGVLNENMTKAWQLLQKSVYDYGGLIKMRGRYAITNTPSLKLNIWTWYNYSYVFDAWALFLNSATDLAHSPAFLHDLVDLSRQVLQIYGDIFYKKLITSFQAKNYRQFEGEATKLLTIFDDLEKILASNKAFLLGPWLASAKACANDSQEEQLYEYNARNQISLWGPNGEIINYANKQWSGVVSHYFQPRWKLFINYMNVSLQTKTKFNESLVRQEVFKKVEEPFTFDRSIFPIQPTGDTVAIAEELYRKWPKALLSSKSRSFRKNRRKGRSSDELIEELDFQNYEKRDPEVIVLG
ncbi:N-acetyl-alpha-glucosaminidase isoform X1 [Leptinotarsa decemlineata]|uniref:N-acetyl-alpha-glucosaminidase isoform X1 n=1 Tax=Leptinotarsa decemlineata TaxID=7539 RepID=UPI003D308C8C